MSFEINIIHFTIGFHLQHSHFIYSNISLQMNPVANLAFLHWYRMTAASDRHMSGWIDEFRQWPLA